MQTDPARDIAAALPTATENTFALHMSTWARKNLLVKVQGPQAPGPTPARSPRTPTPHGEPSNDPSRLTNSRNPYLSRHCMPDGRSVGHAPLATGHRKLLTARRVLGARAVRAQRFRCGLRCLRHCLSIRHAHHSGEQRSNAKRTNEVSDALPDACHHDDLPWPG